MEVMKRILFVMSIFILISFTVAFETNQEQVKELTSTRSRFSVWTNPRALATCDVFPRLCRVKGSKWPDCCKKRCVNVMADNLNCGWCGRRCRYGEGCCKGECVSLMYDRNHCGSCNSRCKKGTYCNYGMCSYA